MKNLLVILMLGAGFVRVASADPLDCNTNPTNQCCIDVVNVQKVINQNIGAGYPTTDGYYVVRIAYDLINDATGSARQVCISKASVFKDGNFADGEVVWVPAHLRSS